MKKYIAIGHYKDTDNLTSVALSKSTKKDFIVDLRGNEFVEFAVLTESMFNKMLNMTYEELWNQVKKLTTNYRKWNEIYEYFSQCYDIMQERLEVA